MRVCGTKEEGNNMTVTCCKCGSSIAPSEGFVSLKEGEENCVNCILKKVEASTPGYYLSGYGEVIWASGVQIGENIFHDGIYEYDEERKVNCYYCVNKSASYQVAVFID